MCRGHRHKGQQESQEASNCHADIIWGKQMGLVLVASFTGHEYHLWLQYSGRNFTMQTSLQMEASLDFLWSHLYRPENPEEVVAVAATAAAVDEDVVVVEQIRDDGEDEEDRLVTEMESCALTAEVDEDGSGSSDDYKSDVGSHLTLIEQEVTKLKSCLCQLLLTKQLRQNSVRSSSAR